jgi:hypothetical protein
MQESFTVDDAILLGKVSATPSPAAVYGLYGADVRCQAMLPLRHGFLRVLAVASRL